jgi:hypothetical protein
MIGGADKEESELLLKDLAMMIECPRCGRAGQLPDRIPTGTNTLRCRKCQCRFTIAAWRDQTTRATRTPVVMTRVVINAGAGESAEVPVISPVDSNPSHRGRGTMSSLARDGFFAGFDEDDPRSPDPGPADSHYELTEGGEVAPDDSVDDWPAVSPSETPSDPWLAATAEPAATEVLTRDPWYYKLIDDFGHLQFYVALTFGALALALLSFLLVRTLSGSLGLDSSVSALVVALVGTMAFLLISLIATVLIVLLVDLARNIRRLRIHADRSAGIPRE